MSELPPEVAEWVKPVEVDYHFAYGLMEMNKGFNPSICFHAQQCVEKYLKAVIVLKKKEFPKTHDLAQLADLAD